MRVAIAVGLALALSMSVVVAGAGQAKPSSYCEPTDERTGAHCHVELSPTCYSDTYVTVEDGYGSDGHCH